MKKLINGVSICAFPVLLIMYSSYAEYNETNQLTTMIFIIIPSLLVLVLISIGNLIGKIEKTNDFHQKGDGTNKQS